MNNQVERRPVADSECTHSKQMQDMFGHVRCMISFGDVVARAADSDILVILLLHLHEVNSNIWMEVETEGRY